MALPTARIRELLTGDGDKFPLVAVRAQNHLQHAEGAVAANFAGRGRLAESSLVLASGPHNEFSDSASRIADARGSLRGKSLVVVIVAVQHHVRAGGVEIIPERLHLARVPVFVPGTEQGNMPIGEDAVGCIRL